MAHVGQESVTPLEPAQLAASLDATKLPNTEASLISVDNPAIVMTTWKLAEDGIGSIVRLVETSGKEQKATLSSAHVKFSRAWASSLLEDKQEELPVAAGGVTLTLRPFEIVTLRLTSGTQEAAAAGSE
jgi:alpha-mannosidase